MRVWVFMLTMVAALGTHAEERAEKLAAAGVAKFQAAYEAWDGTGFAAAAELFQQAISHAPDSSSFHYWLGVAYFHHLLQLQTQPGAPTDTPAARAAMDAALAALKTAVELDERDAESHALLGTLWGMRINGNLFRAVRFGPRVQAHRKKALQFGSDNPRVQYLLGTCQFHTARKPAAWHEALASFSTAEELFAAEARRTAGPLEPRWGRSSCLTFTGRTHELLGERAAAAEAFRRALALHPADHVASEGLARVTDEE
jgi:tetratricopeptide (TPR) repeat protein